MKKILVLVTMFISGYLMVRFGYRIVEDAINIFRAEDICMMAKGLKLTNVGRYSMEYIPFSHMIKELIMFFIGTTIGIIAFPTEKKEVR